MRNPSNESLVRATDYHFGPVHLAVWVAAIFGLASVPGLQATVLDNFTGPKTGWTDTLNNGSIVQSGGDLTVGQLRRWIDEPKPMGSGEYPNAGYGNQREGFSAVVNEWTEILMRDRNHPAIVGWCPLNETGPEEGAAMAQSLLAITQDEELARQIESVASELGPNLTLSQIARLTHRPGQRVSRPAFQETRRKAIGKLQLVE